MAEFRDLVIIACEFPTPEIGEFRIGSTGRDYAEAERIFKEAIIGTYNSLEQGKVTREEFGVWELLSSLMYRDR